MLAIDGSPFTFTRATSRKRNGSSFNTIFNVRDEDPFITLGLYRVNHARISQNGVKKVKDFIDERKLANISWYSGAHFNDNEVEKRRKGYFNSR